MPLESFSVLPSLDRPLTHQHFYQSGNKRLYLSSPAQAVGKLLEQEEFIYPAVTHEFIPGLSAVRLIQYLVFCVMFC